MKKRNQDCIIPFDDLFKVLNEVDQPGRYVGGEFGSVRKTDSHHFRVALSFPDLYEIGMSNTAIKLIYGALNTLPDVACERVFVPAPDFEDALRRKAMPLYTLETGTPLNKCDLLAVSFSYELLATNLITLLASGGIPVRSSHRAEHDPIVLIGGPGATNPAPYGAFIDGAFLGEAEAGLPQLVSDLAGLKARGASRADRVARLREHASIWYPGRADLVRRAIWNGFSEDSTSRYGAGFPVPSIPVIQDHGVVEIMRGCPQGCRFCHAGVYYRPYRMRSVAAVMKDCDWLVHGLGYREISLSSLSSGDYGPLQEMMTSLNQRYQGMGVSLQLPSLRVDSFTLPILEQLNTVRRAGLTFAVESAGPLHQAWTNKLVPLEKVVAIAAEARNRGWRRAKLYFMAGLPGPDASGEWERIVEYVTDLRRAVPLEYVVNVGTFVPKPHTPFQWEPQLAPDAAAQDFLAMKKAMPKGVSVRYHDPWMSWLEGVLTRGDERVGQVIESAHAAGARLDAWTEYLRIEIWKQEISKISGGDRGVGAFGLDEALPWDGISLGVSKAVLRKERDRAYDGLLTERCLPQCEDRCGVCNVKTTVKHIDPAGDTSANVSAGIEPGSGTNSRPTLSSDSAASDRTTSPGPGRGFQLLLEFRKTDAAGFLPHLAMVRTFERFFNRIGLPLELTAGHHPKPKMSFGQPLPIGVESDCEIGVINLQNSIQLENYSQRMFALNALPDGLVIKRALMIEHEHGAPRVPAPMQQYGGSVFLGTRNKLIESDIGEEAEGRFLDCCRARDALVVPADGQGFWDWEIRLPADSWGLGRILKESGARGAVKIRRKAMYPRDDGNVSLFDWYKQFNGEFIQAPM